jgi:hypothetical protein
MTEPAASRQFDDLSLGAAAEALIARAFADTLTLPARAVAKLLGMDEKTLRATERRGLISSVPAGSGSRRFTEASIRLYLARGKEAAPQQEPEPCPSTNRPKRRADSLVSFTARKGKLRDAPVRRARR